jgi:hypothetical protein
MQEPISKITTAKKKNKKKVGSMVQEIEDLLTKQKALSSNFSTAKNKGRG